LLYSTKKAKFTQTNKQSFKNLI